MRACLRILPKEKAQCGVHMGWARAAAAMYTRGTIDKG